MKVLLASLTLVFASASFASPRCYPTVLKTVGGQFREVHDLNKTLKPGEETLAYRGEIWNDTNEVIELYVGITNMYGLADVYKGIAASQKTCKVLDGFYDLGDSL